MTGGLIEWVREEAERLAPPVRAAALMRMARVLTASDRNAARGLFERALEEARSIPGRDGESLLEDARMYAAAIAPERVSEIPTIGRHGPKGFLSDRVGRIMIEHRHFDAALEFALGHDDAGDFPFNVAYQLIDKLDRGRQLTVLWRTIEAWRQGHPEPSPGYVNGFLHLFCGRWNLLPMEEARSVAREIVDITLKEPDARITARYGAEPKLEITSWREHVLFKMLHVLRAVDPELALSLIETHEQLANAARRWPDGFESMHREMEAQRKTRESEGKKGGGRGMVGSPDSFPYLKALRKASEDSDFLPAFEFAAKKYQEDSAPANPNQALKASWPSSCMYCTILYQAGRGVGEAAASYLEQIADPDQRLLARIELAAAVAGLPEFQQTQRGFFPRWNRRSG